LKEYYHIIWDWNGTLLDDAWLCREIMNGMLERRKLLQLSSERYAQIFGFPVKEYYRRAGWIFEDEPFEKLSNEFIGEYERRKMECPLREGSVNILKRNSEKGIQQSIISASKQSSVDDMVKFYGVEDLFVAVRGLDDHHAFGKTDIGIQWIAELALDPESILMVGDTVHDHEVAQAMGVECVLVVSGHQDYARLSTCGVPVVQSLGELHF
jgi:phosphoglycolate phosphatase